MRRFFGLFPPSSRHKELRELHLRLSGPEWPIDLARNIQRLALMGYRSVPASKRSFKQTQPVVGAAQYRSTNSKDDHVIGTRS